MMAQYLAIKAQYWDALLFYRMGDFYELFFEDAVKASAALDIALTKRGQHKGEDIAMCGVPAVGAEPYLEKLIRKGFKVGTSATLRMAEPRPATNLNPAAVASYERMRLRVMRQVHFNPATNQSVDLVLFVNGLPVATIELSVFVY